MKLHEIFSLGLLEQRINERYVHFQKHPTEPLIIYNYTASAQYDRVWDDVTRQCRGLVVHSETEEIVARPWPKFFNLGEHPVDLDPNMPVRAFDKWDGSLGILYPISDEMGWAIATRGSFTSWQAIWATHWLQNHVDRSFFDSHMTHLFEILIKSNRIVVDYDWEGLVLLGIRDTATGEDIDLSTYPRILQARTPRDDRGEHIHQTKRLEIVSSLSKYELPKRSRKISREAECNDTSMALREQGSSERTTSDRSAENSKRLGYSKEGSSLSRLWRDFPSNLHGFRSRKGRKDLQCRAGKDDETTENGDREMRACLRELSSNQNTFRIADSLPCSTLGEALSLKPRPNAEGLVLRFEDGLMLKLKQDDYVALHRILTGTNARNVWETAAVKACAHLISDPKHWGSYLGIDPARAAECLAIGDDWLENIPDEFHAWVKGVTADCLEIASRLFSEAIELAVRTGEIKDRRERFEAVRDHLLAKEIMRYIGDHNPAPITLRAWREACPEPTAPFSRSEDVA